MHIAIAFQKHSLTYLVLEGYTQKNMPMIMAFATHSSWWTMVTVERTLTDLYEPTWKRLQEILLVRMFIRDLVKYSFTDSRTSYSNNNPHIRLFVLYSV